MASHSVFGKLGDFAATLTKGAHIEVEGTLRSREQTVELKGSSKKNPETKTVRSWFIRAESIRKLDRAENSAEHADHISGAGTDDVVWSKYSNVRKTKGGYDGPFP
jgi:single-strand DNA-binding protein